MASQWDIGGRRTRLTYPGSGLYVDYDYHVTGETTKIRENGATSGIGVLATFAYDSLGRRSSLTFGNGTSQDYSFDPVSRLSSLTANLAGTSNDLTIGTMAYNPASQILSAGRSNDAYGWTGAVAVNRNYTSNGLNQYGTAGPASFTYDARGNLTSDGSVTFGYSSENQLTSASGALSATLGYDPAMRLYQVASGPTTARFAYDGLAMIAEYDGANALQRRFVHGPGVDEALVQYEGSGTATRRFLHADERGSIVAVSDDSGNRFAANSYDEYGIPGSANYGRFQYTGQMWIPELGLYHYKARAYSPSLGRFLQTDPIGYGDGLNMYAYVKDDPMNAIDPTGLSMFVCKDGTRVSSLSECGAGNVSSPEGGPTPGAPVGPTSDNPDDCGPTGCYVNLPDGRIVWVSVQPSILGSVFIVNGVAAFNLTYEALVEAAERADAEANNPCGGSVRAVGVNFTGIVGLGLTGSFGRVTVNRSGEGSWFGSFGFGAGLEGGVSAFATHYRDLSSFSGFAENASISFPVGMRSLGGTGHFNIDGEHVGVSGSGSGLGPAWGLKGGASVTNTDTKLLSGMCK